MSVRGRRADEEERWQELLGTAAADEAGLERGAKSGQVCQSGKAAVDTVISGDGDSCTWGLRAGAVRAGCIEVRGIAGRKDRETDPETKSNQ